MIDLRNKRIYCEAKDFVKCQKLIFENTDIVWKFTKTKIQYLEDYSTDGFILSIYLDNTMLRCKIYHKPEFSDNLYNFKMLERIVKLKNILK